MTNSSRGHRSEPRLTRIGQKLLDLQPRMFPLTHPRTLPGTNDDAEQGFGLVK